MQQFLLKFGLLSILMIIIIGSLASAQTITYAYTLTTTLASSNLTTPIETTASGTAIAVLVDNELTVTGIYQNLSSPLRENTGLSGGVTIRVAPPGEEARTERTTALQRVRQEGIFMNLTHTEGTSGTFSGMFTLSDEQLQALGDGLFYIQLNTTNHRDGELRGQLTSEIVDLGFNAEDMVGTWEHSGGTVTYSADGTARAAGRSGTWTFENHILTWTLNDGGGCRSGDVDVYYVEGFNDGLIIWRRSRDISVQCTGVGGGWLTFRKR